MSRDKGTFTIQNNYELDIKGPIDARTHVKSYSDLLGFTAGQLLYNGFLVTLYETGSTYNGVWQLTDENTLNSINSWQKIGSGSNTTILQSVTYAELDSLKTAGTLYPGRFYKISDRGDYGIILQALGATSLSYEGVRIMACPLVYDFNFNRDPGFNGLGTLNRNYAKFYTVFDPEKPTPYMYKDVAIYGGYLWQKTYDYGGRLVVGPDGTPEDDVNLDTTIWTKIPKTQLTVGKPDFDTDPINGTMVIDTYGLYLFKVYYDFDNDWIDRQIDSFGNEVGVTKKEYDSYIFYFTEYFGYNFLIETNPCDITDWNILGQYYKDPVYTPNRIRFRNNKMDWGFYNNNAVYANQIDYSFWTPNLHIENNTVSGRIAFNYLKPYEYKTAFPGRQDIQSISNNTARDIQKNTSIVISNNDLSGANTTISDESITLNLGSISNNDCYASISNNSTNGSILNNTFTYGSPTTTLQTSRTLNRRLDGNTNNGDISNNTIIGASGLCYNSNNGSIYDNNPINSIYRNSNDGVIYNNIFSGDVKNNSNIGQISNNNLTPSVVANESGSGTTTYYWNIINNSNKGDISGNTNKGDISNNSGSSFIKTNSNTSTITGNSCGKIENNSNSGSIDDNVSSGGYITNNSNSLSIDRNIFTGYISGNKNNGQISFNTCDSIYNNGTDGLLGPGIANLSTGNIMRNKVNKIFDNYLYRGLGSNPTSPGDILDNEGGEISANYGYFTYIRGNKVINIKRNYVFYFNDNPWQQIEYNTCAEIKDNGGGLGLAYCKNIKNNNMSGSIYNNNNKADITDNACASIYNNDSPTFEYNAYIVNNKISGSIYNHTGASAMYGRIAFNDGKGSIYANRWATGSLGKIEYNSTGADIRNNIIFCDNTADKAAVEGIWGNDTGYIESNNIQGNIYYNNTGGSIRFNSNSGDIVHNARPCSEIRDNTNNGDIAYNSCVGWIAQNANNGDIFQNSNDGDIYGNGNKVTHISLNKNNGHIGSQRYSNFGGGYQQPPSTYNPEGLPGNNNSGPILGNANNGNIYGNENTGSINYNTNNGPIYNNTNNGDIYVNSNAGSIINNSNGSGIFLNSNKGKIDSNTNGDTIYFNSNNGEITSNGCDVISFNTNNGYISNNNNTGSINYNNNNGYIENLTSSTTNQNGTISNIIG
jgi:hypothetical protein